MNTIRENVKNEYLRYILNEDPMPLKDEQIPEPQVSEPAPVEAPAEEPVVQEPATPAPVTEKTKDIQSKVISILSSKLMGDVKDKIYEMKFLLKKSTDPKVFEIIAAINSDIKDINAQILNTFNR